MRVEPVGQHRRVMLTELGENALTAFRHLLSERTTDALVASERSTSDEGTYSEPKR